ncbi:hypothetical protein FJ973_05940 [Mesorhizobium sp. B2-1-3]|uniref:hypothetical protein n=1 Tax=Mesorhizobium sp. B2-1-3 TaxID=2589972 RepID=UPI0011295297|nr:hypothetical protein [Mesorhizobium sp. B2-1-3]TPN16231.1 hypothetical protein FJ973_05940 [Mesorhizobium sp. B2-1-3]
MATETKTEFAARCNVSPGRVSQWIAAGKIKRTSLEGEGRSAKIVIAAALADLKRSLDVSQSIGLNGFATKLNNTPPADAAPAVAPLAEQTETAATKEPEPRRQDDTSEQIAQERLRQAKIQTRKAEREEALLVGRYMLREEAEAQIARTAGMVLTTVESGFNGMADALAAEFSIPRRDVLHTLNKAFRTVREAATRAFAEKEAAIAKAEAEAIEDDEEDDQED